MNSAELDFGEKGGFGIPESIKAQYRAVLPDVLAVNPQFVTAQDALDNIRIAERSLGVTLFGGAYLINEATYPRRASFNRIQLRLAHRSKFHSFGELKISLFCG